MRTREGRDLWVLVHAEVQGDAQTQFAKRMFQYNDRIRDRTDRAVVSLAVFSDSNRERVEAADIEQLDAWLDNILTAERPDTIFH